ncbi:crotonase/enoyl-CoA hydratase family protein [Arenibaculum pallidiluteum]|uniref:crotonase/enoyl-CoA hydratase family protein n=1 Tax=Arenibaculum pallidiluteum TaxID=2812559 RepID=UPI001A975AAE|nr:crotonase/enoyl-CoA hydratase family protein [Arenibaculum pallidiluteum]
MLLSNPKTWDRAETRSEAAPCWTEATHGTAMPASATEAGVELAFEEQIGAMWCRFRFAGRPNFSAPLLGALRSFREGLRAEPEGRVRYVVYGSTEPGVFNLGGDLALFCRAIRLRDRAALEAYATACIDECWANHTSLSLPLLTIALVQGNALGGGFEAALSSNMIVAERSARFGLPEVMFNLFPGMGAFSFLSRRITPALAERMITGGRTYTAEELHEMGIVDVLAEDGCGEDAVRDFIARNDRRHASLRAIHQARRRVNPLTYSELADIVGLWVDTAMGLGEQDLRTMERLVSAQDRRQSRQTRAIPQSLRAAA